MNKFIAICSWSLLTLGVVVTGYFVLPNTGSLLAPFVFLPYLLLAIAIRAAKHVTTSGVVFAVTLLLVVSSFLFLRDAAVAQHNSMNETPLLLAIVQSLFAEVMSLGVRHAERKIS